MPRRIIYIDEERSWIQVAIIVAIMAEALMLTIFTLSFLRNPAAESAPWFALLLDALLLLSSFLLLATNRINFVEVRDGEAVLVRRRLWKIRALYLSSPEICLEGKRLIIRQDGEELRAPANEKVIRVLEEALGRKIGGCRGPAAEPQGQAPPA